MLDKTYTLAQIKSEYLRTRKVRGLAYGFSAVMLTDDDFIQIAVYSVIPDGVKRGNIDSHLFNYREYVKIADDTYARLTRNRADDSLRARFVRARLYSR